MTVFAALALAAVSTNLFLGVVVLQRHRRLVNRIFFAFCCCLATWSLSVYVLTEPGAGRATGVVWSRIMVSAAAVAPSLFLHLVLLNFGEVKRRIVLPAYVGSAVLVAMTLGGLTVGGVRPLPLAGNAVGWYGTAAPLAPIVPLFAATAAYVAVSVLFRNVRYAAGIRRGQATYLLVAITPALAIGLHDLLGLTRDHYLGTEIAFMPLFPLASIVWTTLGGYAILRHRLMDLDAALVRGIGEAVLFALIITPTALILVAAEKAYFGRTVPEFSALAITVCTAATLAFPLLRAALRSKVGAVLVRGASYRQVLVEFSKEATRILELDRLIDRVNRTLVEALRVARAGVYVTELSGACRLGGAVGDAAPALPERLGVEHPLRAFSERSNGPLVREEIELAAECEPGQREAAEAMRGAGIEVAIPLTTPERFEGLVVLGPKTSGAMFSEEDIEVLTILANQLSTAMSNARLYADLKRSQELIQRSDRLSAIGTMAAGLAHEIRNPLVSIRTFTQLLPERVDDEEFRSKFFDLTLSEVDRICALVSELLAFARPAPAQLQRVDLNDSIDRICLLLESQARNRGVRLNKHLHHDLAHVTVDEDQIKQVAMNIILNAIQACSEGGCVEVATYPGGENDRFVCIEVSDDGRGIEPGVVKRIFDPFFTTRREGTGLGLSIAHQIISRHGGYIDVRSQPGQGASFVVYLPVDAGAEDTEEAVEGSAEEATVHG
ncbi:MAG: hypothetical protein D6760_06705 [Deltaproteobacteria bacterium]|nr:MAG: hypothetical protein D6760_06705 [Deltaproteobacteria bacterium]